MADGTLPQTAGPSAFVAAPNPPPAPVDLRPLTTSELIDRGFSLYRAHFTGFLLLALLAESAPLLGQIAIVAFKLNPTQPELLSLSGTVLTKLCLLSAIVLVGQV